MEMVYCLDEFDYLIGWGKIEVWYEKSENLPEKII